MEILQGKSVFGGIAIGPLSVFRQDEVLVKRQKISDAEAEVRRYHQATEEAKRQLQELYQKAVKEVGEASAAIFDVHQMLLEDLDYVDSVENIIRNQGLNAEYAVATTGDNFSNMFAAMDDDYMKERAADVRDVSDRLVKVLAGAAESTFVKLLYQ